jgi:methylenetetrahydrofolate reductase (NADPH)
MKSGSNLERVLEAGEFAVTAELGPPMDCNGEVIIEKARLLKGCADAYNITDNQTAVVRMSSIASAVLIMQEGLEPVMQMTYRDRNRIAIQADILGAAALGIRNCLCIAGDHQSFSAAGRLKGHPGARNVYDVDSIQLVAALKGLRDDGLQQGGDVIECRPPLFIGAAWTPMGEPLEYRPTRLGKKVAAGADFIQTQGVYDIDVFGAQMAKIVKMGLHERTAILAGIIVPKSGAMLEYMDSSVAGVIVPAALIERMNEAKAQAGDDKQQARLNQEEEGLRISVELIQQVREIEGVRGVHLQAIEWEMKVPEIVERAGLLPRPVALRMELGEGLQPCACERILVYRCLVNLLSHALSSCALSGGEVVVRTRPTDNGQAAIEVSHNGPADALPASSDPDGWRDTCQAHTTRGIGLPTAAHLARALGGRLEFGSAPDGGTLYRVCLPIVCSEAVGTSDASAPR